MNNVGSPAHARLQRKMVNKAGVHCSPATCARPRPRLNLNGPSCSLWLVSRHAAEHRGYVCCAHTWC